MTISINELKKKHYKQLIKRIEQLEERISLLEGLQEIQSKGEK